MQVLKRNIDLILILVIGFALRFSTSIIHSYTNDELSAINRLRFESFSDLIEKGVKAGDMHPAGVQVFEKIWSSVFGTSEMALRFPFVLCGTASIFMIFIIGLKWFNRRTGIYAATLFSFLYFPIIQSELARPYAPGLLITLLSIWFFHKVLFCEVKKIKHAVFLGLTFAAGMYTHYFLFLFLVLIGFTGLFFLKKDNYRGYFLAAGLAVLLFTPHISITLAQLNVGGLQWLGPPENTFLIEFVFFGFNNSTILLIVLFMLIISSFFYSRKDEPFRTKYYLLSALWFFGIYLLAHILSLVSTPILKPQVMYFAFPLLLLLIGYLISTIPFEKAVFAALMMVSIGSTLWEKELYGIQHMGYKNTAKHLVEWNEVYGDENIYTMYNLGNPNYMNFYAIQYGDTLTFERDVIEFWDQDKIRPELIQRTEPFCVVGYSERPTTVQVFETVKEFYPFIVECHHFDQSAVFLMSKDSFPDIRRSTFEDTPHRDVLSTLDLSKASPANKGWLTDSTAWQLVWPADSAQNGKPTACYELNNERIYGPDFIFKKSDTERFTKNYLKVEIKAICPADGQLTVSMAGTRDGKILMHRSEPFWIGWNLEDMLTSTTDPVTGIGTAYFAFEIPAFIQNTDELKISLWNRNGKKIRITSFEIYVVENNWN